ncbi:MAG: hypothetical protein U0746_09620 [Gemmataceae bacterium]
MLATDNETTIGVFDHQDQARRAIMALKAAGFRDEQLGVASREWSKKFEGVSADDQNIATDGAVWGAAVGGGLGAVVGLVGSILVPGAVPIVAGSVLANMLLGGAAGAAGGAFGGPFIAMGLSETDAERHARHVAEGKTVLLIHAPERHQQARDILIAAGAYDDSMANKP